MKHKKKEKVEELFGELQVSAEDVVFKKVRDYSKVGNSVKRKIQLYEAMENIGLARQRKLDRLLTKI